MEERLKRAVRDYFLSRGCEEIEPPKGVDAAFREGENLVGVKVVVLDVGMVGLVAAKRVREAMLELLKEASGLYDKLYIAVPEVGYRSLPLPSEFRRSGVGLLEVGEKGVVERVPARLLKGRPPTQLRVPPEFETRVKALEERVARLEQRLNELYKLLEELRSSRPPEGLRAPPPASAELLEAEELPEFVRDNPWLVELSKRRG
ncbi:MAG: hypothetical protein DRK00_05790 [Thermoprotei archaeon]|nr:MAG: hypothetical protein DRK00_05790 [Thermoprotei archaeon]